MKNLSNVVKMHNFQFLECEKRRKIRNLQKKLTKITIICYDNNSCKVLTKF